MVINDNLEKKYFQVLFNIGMIFISRVDTHCCHVKVTSTAS